MPGLLSRPWTLAGLFVRSLVTLSVLALVLWGLDFGAIGGLFAEFKFQFFALAVLAAVAAHFPAMYAWKALLHKLSVRLPVADVVRLYLVGLFINQFVPGGFMGDVARVYMLHRKVEQAMEGITSILISRAISILTLLLVGGATAAIMNPGLTSSRLTFALLLLVLAALGALAASVGVIKPSASRPIEGRLADGLMRVATQMDMIKNNPTLLTIVTVSYTVHHVLVVVSVYLVAAAVGLQIPLLWMLALVPLGRLLVLLPISIGGIGVQEGAYIFLFGQLGVDAAASFSISVLSQLSLAVVPLGGGLLILVGRMRTMAARKAVL